MVSAEKFCLRWNDFESNISVAFRELREEKDFFDVTLACDDEQIQAHKVILSACSPFFRTILKRNSHDHPLLYLKGVKYIDLVSVLNFMYHGEVNVSQEELNSFLAIAEELKVKGLTQNKSENLPREREDLAAPTTKLPREPPAIEQMKPMKRPLSLSVEPQQRARISTVQSLSVDVPSPSPTGPAARLTTIQTIAAEGPSPSRLTTIEPLYQADDNYDIQELVPVKEEPDVPQDHDQDGGQLGQAVENSMAMYEENYAAYDNYEDNSEQTYDDAMMTAAKVDENKALDLAISNSMVLVYNGVDGMTKVWQCLHCSKTNKDKSAIRRHVESHLGGHTHTCTICYKTYKTRFSLKVHMTREHRNDGSY